MGREARAETKQEKGRFLPLLFLTLQTALVSLYLEKKIQSVSCIPFQYLQLFPCRCCQGLGLRGRRRETGLSPHRPAQGGDSPGRQKQVPVALCGNKEDNQAVEDMAMSKQKLCATAEPSSCLSVSCSIFGDIKGGRRMSAMQGKAQQHRCGFRERG